MPIWNVWTWITVRQHVRWCALLSLLTCRNGISGYLLSLVLVSSRLVQRSKRIKGVCQESGSWWGGWLGLNECRVNEWMTEASEKFASGSMHLHWVLSHLYINLSFLLLFLLNGGTLPPVPWSLEFSTVPSHHVLWKMHTSSGWVKVTKETKMTRAKPLNDIFRDVIPASS